MYNGGILPKGWDNRQGWNTNYRHEKKSLKTCPGHLKSLQTYHSHNKNLYPIQVIKTKITSILILFPSIHTLITHAMTFTQHRVHSQYENCELGNTGGWNIVYMMTFHNEDILKAAWATLYGLDNYTAVEKRK